MTDLLGPASATNAVTVRPPETRVFGLIDTWFKDCTSPSQRDGTAVEAAYLNGLLAQIRDVIRKSGTTIDNADDSMLARSIRRQRLNYVVDQGTTNALSVELDPAPVDWTELIGAPLRVLVGSSNTGPATLAVSGLAGVKPVTLSSAAPLVGGELLAGAIATLIFDGDRFQVSRAPFEGGLQIFTSSGTFTVPSGVTRVRARVWGGGGGGGGSNSGWAGGGGGGGGYAEGIYVVVPGQTIPVTVGPGGGAAGGNGNPGGTSSFGAFCSATGGAGGQSGFGELGLRGLGGTGSGGDINLSGSEGGSAGGNADRLGGAGGAAPFGGSGTWFGTTIGGKANTPGGGGGGSANGNTPAGGAPGLVIVEW